MAPSKMKLRGRKRGGASKVSQRSVDNASPDSKCPICLDNFKNVASLDRCLHRFCFRCIHEWSKNKAECPLCKQPFRSIFHSVRGESDFKEFVLCPPENVPDQSQRLLRPRVLRGRSRRSQRTQDPTPSTSPPVVGDGVMFDRLAANQDVEQMLLRLMAQRGSGRDEGRSLRRLRDQDVITFRRALYRTGIRVRNNRDANRQRDVSASFLRQNPSCLRRILPWIQRELTVLYGSHGSLVNIVQNIIISRIMNYNMEDPVIRDELRPFLLARTDHFLHELVSFVRSNVNMEEYDQQAVYEGPTPSYEEGSSSEMSVIAISEDEDDESDGILSSNQSALQEPTAASGTESLLSQSAWDDETPGTSFSSLHPTPSHLYEEGAEPSSSTLKETAISGEISTNPECEEEECLIVGYVKPMAERTPELVQLSSDSSEEEQDPTDIPENINKPQSDPKKVVNSLVQNQSEAQTNPVSSSPVPASSKSVETVDPHINSLVPCNQEQENDFSSYGYAPKENSPLNLMGSQELCVTNYHVHSSDKKQSHALSRTNPRDSISPQSLTSTLSTSSSDSYARDYCTKNRSRQKKSHIVNRPSHFPCHSKRRKGETKRKLSPDLDLFSNSKHFQESKRYRRHHRCSVSTSSADSLSERSFLDKPSGKRKYKMRHLERVARKQNEEEKGKKKEKHRKKRGRSKDRSRSPSIEIIYEKRAPDPYSALCRKKKHRKRQRDSSPTVITIDSDSDRTIDCLDRVMDVIDQTVAEAHMQFDGRCNMASSSHESRAQSNECALNVSDCAGDMNKHRHLDGFGNMDINAGKSAHLKSNSICIRSDTRGISNSKYKLNIDHSSEEVSECNNFERVCNNDTDHPNLTIPEFDENVESFSNHNDKNFRNDKQTVNLDDCLVDIIKHNPGDALCKKDLSETEWNNPEFDQNVGGTTSCHEAESLQYGEQTINLDDCLVDVVDNISCSKSSKTDAECMPAMSSNFKGKSLHKMDKFDGKRNNEKMCQFRTVGSKQPSDSRLLESILQDLQFLPACEQDIATSSKEDPFPPQKPQSNAETTDTKEPDSEEPEMMTTTAS